MDESKDIDRPTRELEGFVADAFRSIVPDGAEDGMGSCRWRGVLRRPVLCARCNPTTHMCTLDASPKK